MPGVVGLITKIPRIEAERRLERMVSCLVHESFYSQGFWCDEELGVYIGWVALKGSFSDEMPVKNETGDAVLFFGGEEFPDPQRIRDLAMRGHEFSLDGPSYLVHLYEDSPSFPDVLNGWFHGVVVDRVQKSILLFNDRYGMHRLYYNESPDAFYFAPEAKAILAVCPKLREFDPTGLAEFLTCGAVLENRTLFREIETLPQASAWVFRNAAVKERRRYFARQDWEALGDLDAKTFYDVLHSTLTRNLPRYFAGDEAIGMSLTGGLDTRVILACRKPVPESLRCYTFGSMLREHQDVRVARQVAQMCGQSFQVLTAGKEFLEDFAKYAERAVYLTDGCADVSRAPDLYLNQKAAGIAPVRMTGNYGGEMLRGVRIFKASLPSAALYAPELNPQFDDAARRFEGIPYSNKVSHSAFQLIPWLLYGTLAIEKTQLTLRAPFLDNDIVQTCFRAPASALTGNEITLQLIGDESKALRELRTDRGLGGNRGRIHSGIVRAYLQFMFKAEYAFDTGMPQWLARLNYVASAAHVEQLFLGRHKPFHFRIWYRDALAHYVQSMLLDERSLSRAHVSRARVESIVRGHVKGKSNHTKELHQLLTLEIVNRTMLTETLLENSVRQLQSLSARAY